MKRLLIISLIALPVFLSGQSTTGMPEAGTPTEAIKKKPRNNRNLPDYDFWNKTLSGKTDITHLKSDSADSFHVGKLYPNPTTDILNVPLSIDKKSMVRIILNNMRGQRLHYLYHDYLEPGIYELTLSTGGIPEDQYFISVDDGTNGFNKSFRVLKE